MLKLLRNRHFSLKNFELFTPQFKKCIPSSNLSDFAQPNLKSAPGHIYSYINERAENSYAYSVIKSLPTPYRGTFQLQNPSNAVKGEDELVAVLDQNWRMRSATEIVDAFRNVVDFCKANEIGLSDARFDKLVDGLMDNVEHLTDDELSQLMICVTNFPPSRVITAHNFHDMWSALDDICCSRVAEWDLETRFKFAELWYLLRLGKVCDFNFCVQDNLQYHTNRLSASDIVRVHFLILVMHKEVMRFELEDALTRCIDELTLDHMGLIALTYRSYTKKIKHKDIILGAMIRRLKAEAKTGDPTTIAAILEVSKRVLKNRSFCKYLGKFITVSVRQRLCKSKLVEALFYLNVSRKKVEDVDFEKFLYNEVYGLSSDELGVVAMAFFKTRTKIISSFLLNCIIRQLKGEILKVHEISLSAILKILRYSSNAMMIDQLVDLLDHLVPEIPRLSTKCCLQIALLGTTLGFFHEKSLKGVAHKLVRSIGDITDMRIKDIERLLLAMTMFNFDPRTEPDFYATVLTELRREERWGEAQIFPKCLPCSLNYLAMRGVYDYELMSKVLDREYLMTNYAKGLRLPRDILTLNTSIDIECPGYTGNRVDEIMLQKSFRWQVEYTPTRNQWKKPSMSDLFIIDVIENLGEVVGGSDLVQDHHILPHFSKADLIVCKDTTNGKFVKPVGLEHHALYDLKKRPEGEGKKWYAVVTVGFNQTIKNTPIPLGIIDMKVRQLKLIGYEPILVIWNEFSTLTSEEKRNYILNKLK